MNAACSGGAENAEVDKVLWKAVRIKYSWLSAYCKCTAASRSTLLVCISRVIGSVELTLRCITLDISCSIHS